jgi:hypothetical protein
MRLLDELVNDCEACSNRRVERDHVEGAICDGSEAVTLKGFGIGDAVRLQVLASEADGALVDVNQGDVPLLRELGGDDADDPVAAAKVEAAVCWLNLHVFDEERGAGVNAVAGEDAGLGDEVKLEAAKGGRQGPARAG